MATITTVNFRSYFAGLRSSRRKNKAAGYLREQIARFSQASPESIRIDRRVNEYMMSNVITGGSPLKLSVNKTASGVEVRLAEDKRAPQKTAPAAAAKESKPAAGVVPDKKPAAKAGAPKAEQPKKEKKEAPEQVQKPAEQPKDKASK